MKILIPFLLWLQVTRGPPARKDAFLKKKKKSLLHNDDLNVYVMK